VIRIGIVLITALAGCTLTGRLELGVRKTTDHDLAWRFGVSVGLGFASEKATRSITQSVGYRYCEDHSATTATRVLSAAGPLYVSGAVEIDHDGFDVAPALLVPLFRELKREPGTSMFPDSGAHARTVTDRSFFPVGVQLRAGRHDGELSSGADLVIGFDDLSGTSAPE
jgi:hypothetical protein